VHSALLLVIVVAAAAFDFTNGFHDTANVVASSISTRALAPRTAITLVSVLNFAGAFISLKVAATIATGIIDAGLVIVFIYRVFGRCSPGPVTRGFRVGQIVSNSAPALAHRTNDAQKTMGVITLALVAHGSLSPHHASVPAWVVILSATAISLGTYAGGWRIIFGAGAYGVASAFGRGALGPLLIAVGGPLSMTLATRRRRGPDPAHPASA
jgi:phosphate/sulfate permease